MKECEKQNVMSSVAKLTHKRSDKNFCVWLLPFYSAGPYWPQQVHFYKAQQMNSAPGSRKIWFLEKSWTYMYLPKQLQNLNAGMFVCCNSDFSPCYKMHKKYMFSWKPEILSKALSLSHLQKTFYCNKNVSHNK